MMRGVLLGVWLMLSVAMALPIESNSTTPLPAKAERNSSEILKQTEVLLSEQTLLDQALKENNIWSKIYSNYHTYKELEREKRQLDTLIQRYRQKYTLSTKEKAYLTEQERKRTTLIGKLQLLKDYKEDPFKKLLMPPHIEEAPVVENPIAVIAALSYQEKLESNKEEYSNRYNSLTRILSKLQAKEVVLRELLRLHPTNSLYQSIYDDVKDQIETFIPVVEIFKTTKNVYMKKIDELELDLTNAIKREMEKATTIGVIILLFIILLLLVKYLVRRYMADAERYYTINKAINFSFVTVLVITLLFFYIENVSYLVTILGFASAGIAIAMKDWFMSLMGWLAILIGGTVRVGDRVKFVKDGVEYVGDIVDISLLRMTMQEDVTLTTVMRNHRAGRIIFIPNNFVFTDMIANYSHAGIKTVWDGIDFMVTFDSDLKKAAAIAKEVTKKYSKGYTDITRKQLNKMRSQYHIKNTNVEPRILTFIEPYGMKVSAWYLTNSYATLTLRSTISAEIIARIQEEESISLAFPTQSLYLNRHPSTPPVLEESTPTGATL